MSANGQLSPEDFVLRAVEKLTPKGMKGFVPSWGTRERLSFNELFARTYPGIDAKALMQQMHDDGKVVIIPGRTRYGSPYVIVCPPGTETLEQRNARYEVRKAERTAKADNLANKAPEQPGTK
jgi:hypothetical protein